MLNPLSWPRRILTLIGLAVVIVVALIVVYFTVIRSDAPPPVTIESAVESLEEQQQQQAEPAAPAAEPAAEDEQQAVSVSDAGYGSAQDGDSAEAEEDAPPADAEETADADSSEGADEAEAEDQAVEEPAEALTLADLAGAWTLAEDGESFVGYRIGETFADIGTATAVGRTSDLNAELDFDGARITRVVITADLRTLRSDQSRRDQALRSRGLETDRFPTATFTLSEPIAIGEAALSGGLIEQSVRGTLELHGVANEVEIALTGQLVDGLAVIVGSSEIALADYEIVPPTNFRVISIEDSGTMEFQIILARR